MSWDASGICFHSFKWNVNTQAVISLIRQNLESCAQISLTTYPSALLCLSSLSRWPCQCGWQRMQADDAQAAAEIARQAARTGEIGGDCTAPHCTALHCTNVTHVSSIAVHCLLR